MALEIDYCGGMCPTQAEGRFDGRPFYFRARHGFWTLTVSGEGEEPWSFDCVPVYEAGGDDDTHGSMPDDEVKAILNLHYNKFKELTNV